MDDWDSRSGTSEQPGEVEGAGCWPFAFGGLDGAGAPPFSSGYFCGIDGENAALREFRWDLDVDPRAPAPDRADPGAGVVESRSSTPPAPWAGGRPVDALSSSSSEEPQPPGNPPDIPADTPAGTVA